MDYALKIRPPKNRRIAGAPKTVTRTFLLNGGKPQDLLIKDAGIIESISFKGDLDNIGLKIAFDNKDLKNGSADGPYQVNAPLRYLAGPFNNALVRTSGDKADLFFPMPFKNSVFFRLATMMGEANYFKKHRLKITVRYRSGKTSLKDMYYFHARYFYFETFHYLNLTFLNIC